MSIVESQIEPLRGGDKLTRDEFLRRWEAMPHLKRAELIGGIVYMPSPVSIDHGRVDNFIAHWLGHYAMYTPGIDVGNNTTWFMLEDAPQSDVFLRIRKEYGGGSWVEDKYLHGEPELLAEVCVSSSSYDFHQKKELYLAGGVKEYLTVLVKEREVRWHRLVANSYQTLPMSREGVIRSVVFPGLWLDVPAFLGGNMLKVIETLEGGLHSPEHADFVNQLKTYRPEA
jgi:Uma2 family endonuclease